MLILPWLWYKYIQDHCERQAADFGFAFPTMMALNLQANQPL